MPKKCIKEIYKQLESELTDKSFLKEAGIQKKTMLKLLKEENWESKIQYLNSLDEITCNNILEVSRSTIENIDSIQRPDWLECIQSNLRKGLFPDGNNVTLSAGMSILLKLIKLFMGYQSKRREFEPTINLQFLNEQEIKLSGIKEEYERFLEFWKEKSIYEFMLISKELTSFNTLGHIAGVHFVAMNISKQLKQLGINIDVALVSGAAAGHDLGKYGCKVNETEKIPYLHYYYTDQLLKENNMPTIAHIAANHSTWDLELENLSAESLVLIYSDFRVKSSRNENNEEIVHFYTLKDSYQVILNKLDNVDDVKKQRYARVYSKLRDFEAYIKSLGVSTELDMDFAIKVEKEPAALLGANESIERLKFLAVEHNINLMSRFNNETSFANLLEAARSEKQWKNIRAYLNILCEYSTYLTQKQKLATLNFLYELLMHREGDIRRQAGSIMATIIINYDEDFRKELPEDAKIDEQDINSLQLWKKFLKDIIFPDYRITEQHKRWIGYSLKTIMTTIISKCEYEHEKNKYLDIFFSYFDYTEIQDGTAFTLLGGLMAIPLKCCSESDLVRVMNFGTELSQREHLEIRIGVLRFAKYAVVACNKFDFIDKIRPYAVMMMDNIKEEMVSVLYLKYKILVALGIFNEERNRYEQLLYGETQIESDLYLENLKVGTPWVIKEVNIEFLLDKLNSGIYNEKLHIATHLSNLVKVSERITVRHSAGCGLLNVVEHLSLDQRNEIIIELTKGLEIGEYQFSKYIPEYLGALAMYLHPRELDELIKDLKKLEDSTSSRVSSVTLDTLGVMLERYGEYKYRFNEVQGAYEARREIMIGMLLRGLANYDEIINQEAFLVIGQGLFGSNKMTMVEKKVIFKSVYKKILTLISDRSENELSFYNSAAALNQIYRFISDYTMLYGNFNFKDNNKVAFFPGTFDPFSLSHKGIAQEIKKLGFEVYLALDEFSWSKKTQPRMIRKQIVSMSIADESDVYIFPESIAVNIANPQDLKQLKDKFKGKELYMVVGSDVIANASSYRKESEPDSIHHMNHIVFQRMSAEEGRDGGNEYGKYDQIMGDVIELKLPIHLEDISSTRIRENIDNNRDISNLIDTVAQNYIYQKSLYLREPQYKSIIRTDFIDFEIVENNRQKIIDSIKILKGDGLQLDKSFCEHLSRDDVSAVIIRNTRKENNILSISLFHELDIMNLYNEFKNPEVASYIRENASGKIIVLSALIVSEKLYIADMEQYLLTETIAHCLATGFTYAVYNPIIQNIEDKREKRIQSVLERQGFIQISDFKNVTEIYFVDMKSPVIIFEDMEMRIKGPFNKNPRVLEVLKKAHKDMQKSLTGIYKGQLVLSFNSGVMYHKLVNMITEENNVPREEQKVRNLGPYMCVPFGKNLEGKAVPNTVTKTLHTEKIFDAKVKGFKIKEYPNYATLENQIITIKSFNRPILLVDDLLHKGYRIKELDPIFKKNGVEINKIIVGVLSGRGKDLMAIQGRNVHTAYFIPNLKTWFTDESMYPFIGGDSVDRDYSLNSGLLPSINLILPYDAPTFLAGENRGAVFEFSLTCLKGAKAILQVLEEEFQKAFERNLTLSRLSEVIISPRCPDKGHSVSYDENLPPSLYVTNDIETLMRLKNII
ncbi:MAG: nicotinate-nicotinamide nucleotide adenylyltransferase [Aminipila sp.]